MKPALTAEEWAAKRVVLGTGFPARWEAYVERGGGEYQDPPRLHLWRDGYGVQAGRDHALAALALYGQPFGFSHEDVREIQDAGFAVMKFGGNRAWQQRLQAIADRIKALLPPETVSAEDS